MSELKPIGDFAKTFAALDLGQYLAGDPPAVLMQDVTKATFRSARGKSGDTVDLLLQADQDARESGETDLGSLPREVAYMVVTLRSSSDPASSRLLLGSSAACDIIIPDQSVSRQHAWLERQGEDYHIEDNHSRNGTWIDSDMLNPGSQRKLSPGDMLTLGSTDLIFLDPAGFYHFVTRFLGG
jgi:hypothetical protein